MICLYNYHSVVRRYRALLLSPFSAVWASCAGVCVLLCLVACNDSHGPYTPVARTSRAELSKLAFHEPSKHSAKNYKNLVVLIHGLGDTPEDFSAHLAELIAATPARFIAPKGVNAYGSGWGWFAFARPLEAPPAAVLTQMRSSTQRLAALIRAQRNKSPNAKVIVVGFSQGGMLSLALALHEPDAVDAVVPIAGWLPKALVPPPASLRARQFPPIRAFHGLADSLVPVVPTKTLIDQLQVYDLDAHMQAYAGTEHEISPAMIRDIQKQLIQQLSD